jgi:hypothetical protein
MNREFLDFYNRELSLLYEQAGDFAEEYPGIAERLGGLIRDRSDPMITGLLEGAAFLAARVPGIHCKPARATGTELSCADTFGHAGDRTATLCRPGAA